MSNAHSSASSIDSVLSFADLELEVVIGSEGPPTSVLVGEARSIVKYMRDDVLVTYKDETVYVGVFLEALLDYAGKDIIPDSVNITGERYTAGVIYAAHRKGKLKVKEVADAWLQYMVIPMLTASNIRTAQPSEERTPHDDESTPVAQNKQKQLRKVVRQREGFRCPLHKEEILKDAPLEAFDAYDSSRLRYLVVCHTLPFALRCFAGNRSNTVQQGKLAIHWAMIKNWTAQSIQELIGEGVDDPASAILLCPHGRDDFKDFRIYFEPDTEGGPNCYIVKSPYEADTGIKFRHFDCVPPPDPRYLAIHRAFAKVLLITGAWGYVNAYDRDQEDMGALASDGSTNVSMILSKLRLIEVG